MDFFRWLVYESDEKISAVSHTKHDYGGKRIYAMIYVGSYNLSYVYPKMGEMINLGNFNRLERARSACEERLLEFNIKLITEKLESML